MPLEGDLEGSLVAVADLIDETLVAGEGKKPLGSTQTVLSLGLERNGTHADLFIASSSLERERAAEVGSNRRTSVQDAAFKATGGREEAED
jgi:hypothetical protein